MIQSSARRYPPILWLAIFVAMAAMLLLAVLYSNLPGDGGQSLFRVAGIPMQALIVLLCAYAVRQLRLRQGWRWFAVPLWVRIVVPLMVVVAGYRLLHLPGSLPPTTPAGVSVKSFNAELQSGRCIAQYNDNERVEQPTGVCRDYQRKFTSAFAAGWVLFGALALWLSCLAFAPLPAGPTAPSPAPRA
ncbi:MAG: hypothetical protein QM718_09570 [Steroidobacteraceae bacterium]